MEEGRIDGMALDVTIDEVEVRSVGDDVVLPDGFDCLDERMFNFDFVLVEDVVGFNDDVEKVVLPFLLEFREFGYFSNAFVN